MHRRTRTHTHCALEKTEACIYCFANDLIERKILEVQSVGEVSQLVGSHSVFRILLSMHGVSFMNV